MPAEDRLPRNLVLLQLTLLLLRGKRLSYGLMQSEYLIPRRTAERYIGDLKRAGLPVETARKGRIAEFFLSPHRRRHYKLEAIDIPPSAARSLSLLLVAAALLPSHLGVREAVDSTVRAALRLGGLDASVQIRRLEDAVLVLENDAKDYSGQKEVFEQVLDHVLEGRPLRVTYKSPRRAETTETFFPATIGLYKGGLYVLALPLEAADNDAADAKHVIWRALERITSVEEMDEDDPLMKRRLSARARLFALDEAKQRWGPARPDPSGVEEHLITLHVSASAAPYMHSRPWHTAVEVTDWPASDGGGARVSLRLRGDTTMFETWVRSWGPAVQVLRPAAMAERIAASFEEAALRHREASAAFSALIEKAAKGA